MRSSNNIALVTPWFDEVYNLRREEAIDELLHPDVVGYHEDEEIHGIAGFKKFHYAVLDALPDLEMIVENVAANGDDQVVAEWLIRATHEGELLGVPPTYKKVQLRGSTWVRMAAGQSVEWRTYRNSSYVLRSQLEQALAEIETLKGILPICAHCKKIRGDEGYWEQVEAYISKHSLAKFSHCLCPACAKEHYAEFMDEL